jgi:hypothetical protein
MATPVQPWTERLRELVAHGPVPRDEAVAEMAALVPPGRAYRDTERVLEWVRTKHNHKTVRESADDEATKDRRIKGGQKRIVRSALWTQIHHGQIEEFEQDGVTMLRQGPKSRPAPEVAPDAD